MKFIATHVLSSRGYPETVPILKASDILIGPMGRVGGPGPLCLSGWWQTIFNMPSHKAWARECLCNAHIELGTVIGIQNRDVLASGSGVQPTFATGPHYEGKIKEKQAAEVWNLAMQRMGYELPPEATRDS